MEEILHQPKGIYPVIYNVLYIPGGAGFLPSTVVSGLHVVQRSPRGPLELRQFLPQAGQNRAIHAFSLHELFFKDLFFFSNILFQNFYHSHIPIYFIVHTDLFFCFCGLTLLHGKLHGKITQITSFDRCQKHHLHQRLQNPGESKKQKRGVDS